jgi:cytochrome c-type biogenesis protein CcmF
MIPEIGHFALILALLVALVQGSLPMLGAARGRADWMAVARPAAVLQLLLMLTAFLALMQAYLASDFTVLNVAQNSHSAKPLLYKITGLWGNHEGSMLLWILILALFGAAVALFGRNLPATLRARVLAVQAWIALGFLAFTLFTSNPFARVFPPPENGNDLNPLLQDPGLAFHPPMLYTGYVGFSIAFSFAVAALIEGRVDAAWARWVRPWTLAAWCFLTAGIALGSWWAYYELGWGHAFATDPERGLFILVLLCITIGGSLTLFAIRAPALKAGGLFAPISREGALVLNNLLLATGCATVFLGTLYPLFLEAFGGAKVSVGAPYFNATFAPLMVPLIAAMAIGPLMSWKRADMAGVFGRLKFAAAAGVVAALAALYLHSGGPVLAILGMALAAWLFTGAVVEWAERVKLFRIPLAGSWARARHLPRSAYGMMLAHGGLAIAVAGMVAAANWQGEVVRVMRPGETADLAGYSYRFDAVRSLRGPNYTSNMATFTVSRDGYAVIGNPDGRGGWTVRIFHEPLVPWIWGGVLIMVAGGILSLSDRRGILSLSDRRLRVGAPVRRRKAAPASPAAA